MKLRAMCLLVVISGVSLAQMSDQPVRLTAAKRTAMVDSVAGLVETIYVFPDTARQMANLIRENLRRGAYDSLDELQLFCARLTEDLRSISHDLHLSVMPLPPGIMDKNGQLITEEENREQRFAENAYHNFGFRELSSLPGNIGYVKLDQFVASEMAGPTAIAALNFLGYSDALIIDLRDNGGGDPSMIQLISSYLFAERKHLNSFYVRAGDNMEQYWTQAFVSGRKLPDIPVYVLTSRYTFSAAEEFSYNLKSMGRAKIVGEFTGGGAHPNDFYSVASLGIHVSVPFGRAINPLTGTNWEGVGVQPDLACAANEALKTATLDALHALAEREKNPARKYELAWILEGKERARNPVQLSADQRSVYVGNFGPRKVFLEHELLYYQRGENPRHPLIPLGNHRFAVDGTDSFRVEFVLNSRGEVTEIVGLYLDGHQDRNKRDNL